MGDNGLRLLRSLQSAMDAPSTEDDPEQRLATFRRKVTAAVERGLWPETADPIKALGDQVSGLYSTAPASTKRQWDWVVSLAADSEKRRIELADNTVVGLLNTYVPSAFTSPTGDEHVIVVDNAFHDFIYGAAKYLVLASDPVDNQDPLWRTARASLPGRFYASARLMRLVLLTMRWHGLVYFPVDALLPQPLTEIAVDEFTEPVQLFVLAHEAGHIALGHTRSALQRLAVGPLSVPAVDCQQNFEMAADLFAAELLRREAERSGLVGLPGKVHALQAAHIFFALLNVFTEYYFVCPPTTHPDPQIRMDRLVERLLSNDERAALGAEVGRRPSFRNLPMLIDLARGDFRGDVPLQEFMGEVRGSRYCFERTEDKAQFLLSTFEELEDHMLGNVEDALAAVTQACLPDQWHEDVPQPLWDVVASATNSSGAYADEHLPARRAAEVELGRLFATHPVIAPVATGLVRFLTPTPGTAFHRWADELRTSLRRPLVLPCLQIAYTVTQRGPDALRSERQHAIPELEAWALQHLNRIQTNGS